MDHQLELRIFNYPTTSMDWIFMNELIVAAGRLRVDTGGRVRYDGTDHNYRSEPLRVIKSPDARGRIAKHAGLDLLRKFLDSLPE